ncbi:cytochrome c oxidase subunit VI [Cavenderia fasciculata]|uniref:Cytochrome c oxidase subunit VI n=1 Tax=Cavenderia fasciculata TaxID=261658 RepID=F4PK18_CACFS|nr:cytochrome c oxidase subunit VI [Cavenderia fasciculata]EGG23942.1 cytochrome c oxidase subunit VI [Cavenderia fasciculata]|eukprot:XP_004361793.1 cytochrome c oxidase subunit VI [Cavenderia fasciculata]
MSEQHNIRFPRGFNGYPYNTFKLEGYGTPKGYITLAGVAATLVGAYIISAGFRSTKSRF